MPGGLAAKSIAMIDLHCHLLPAVDDGSVSIEMSLEMARIAVGDGITHIACTPHITPGKYDNEAFDIARRVTELTRLLAEHGIPLQLSVGADIQVCSDLLNRLARGSAPTLNGSRYFLFEPLHDRKTIDYLRFAKTLIVAGYVPILTHPERLAWIEDHYDEICRLDEAGVVIQLTAGSIASGFPGSKRSHYWSMRMLDEGRVDLVATDAHNLRTRRPILSGARAVIADRYGEKVADRLTSDNPGRILRDEPLHEKVRQLQAGGTRTRNPRNRLFGWLVPSESI